MKFSQFLEENATRSSHNEGFELVIGEGQHIVIYGVDSDVARQIAIERYRIDPSNGDVADQVRKLYARLVKSWSFDEPVTVELAEELFREYPFIYDKVLDNYSKRSNFMKSRSASSANTQNLK